MMFQLNLKWLIVDLTLFLHLKLKTGWIDLREWLCGGSFQVIPGSIPLQTLFSVLTFKHYNTTCEKLANPWVAFVILITLNH